MKVSPKDMPKIVVLIVMIGGCLIYIGSMLLNRPQETVKKAPDTNIVSGQPTQTAALEPVASAQQYVEQIEEWSKPPVAPPGDPFRMVLSHDKMQALRSGRSNTPSGGRSEFAYFGGGNNPANPFGSGMPDVRIDFPTITVTGVIVDTSMGAPTNFATVKVGESIPSFVKEGSVLADDLVVKRVTNRGIQIRAANEVAFIEVSKSYKPHGMAAPAPSEAGGRRSRRNR